MDTTTITNLLSSTVEDFTFSDLIGDCSSILWVVIVGFIVAFILSFGVGANDVANCFGSSVGSGVISLRNACILATIFEMAGAVLIGHKVSDTIRKGIIDLGEYQDTPEEYMLGNLSALGGSAIWLLVATFLKMPISGTHSIVGSVLGFSLVARGLNGVNWVTLGKIVGSWFVSPVLSGFVSGAIFYLIRRFILVKRDPISPGLISLPIFYGLTVFVNVISILLDGPEVLKIHVGSLPKWTETGFGILIAIGVSILVAVLIALFFVPRLRRAIRELIEQSSKENDTNSIDKNDKINNIYTIGLSSNDITNSNSFDNKEMRETSASDSLPPQLNNVNGVVSYKNELNHNNGNIKNYLQSPESLEAIPMDGITPNSSGVPLIMESIEKGPKQLQMLNNSFDFDYEEGGITFGQPALSETSMEEPDDRPGVGKLFSFLQIMTAAFGSFAHGGNDVSNAIGPLIALYLVYKEGRIESEAPTPIWLLIFGGVGISLGLWVWGRRVIKTMGEDLTKITPSSGFTIEIGSAMTVLVASKIGIPVSTTHCKVGSVVSVGWLRSSKGGVDWTLFRNIIFAWVVTLPISAGLSALLMLILRTIML